MLIEKITKNISGVTVNIDIFKDKNKYSGKVYFFLSKQNEVVDFVFNVFGSTKEEVIMKALYIADNKINNQNQ